MGSDERDDPEVTGDREQRAANLFDLRRIIGGLFILYGLILVVVGLGDGDASIAKASGVHINLLTGIGMLVVGGLFLLWAFTRPLSEQLAEAESNQGGGGAGRDREGPPRGGGPRSQ